MTPNDNNDDTDNEPCSACSGTGEGKHGRLVCMCCGGSGLDIDFTDMPTPPERESWYV